MSKVKFIQIIAGTAALIGTSVVAYYLLRKKYTILTDQNVKLSEFQTKTIEQFLLEGKITTILSA